MNLTGREPYRKGIKPAKSARVRAASRDAVCQLAIPGVCLQSTETVVGCHVSIPGMSAGMGQKNDDLFLIDGCRACHAVFDNRAAFADAPIDWLDVLRALMKSQQQRRAAGLILLDGE